MDNNTRPATDRLLRIPEVLHLTGLSRTTVWRMEKAGLFPRRVKLSTNTVAYRESAIQAFIAAREDVEGAA